MRDSGTAAIVTVGTEITSGLRLDTNTREIARAAREAGYVTRETVSVPDDRRLLADTLSRLVGLYDLVVVTGGLGPTHDDITREAASDALSAPLVRMESLLEHLKPWAERQSTPAAVEQVFTQALVLTGAEVIDAITGTAPGQIATTASGGRLVLLPGPPSEMRPMLARVFPPDPAAVAPRELAVVGMGESDAQMIAQGALASHPWIDLTLLAAPGDVRVVLFDAGAGASALDAAARDVREAFGDACVSDDGSTLAEVVVRAAIAAGVTIATAESCTGGLVGGALTSVPGSSATYRGGVIAYDNNVKMETLGVPAGLLAQYGAVSEQTARAMAEEVRRLLGADLAIGVTGIAGPDGGTDEKPVGTVWFGIAGPDGSSAVLKTLPGDRAGVRARATIVALDLLRRELRKDVRP